MKRKSSLLIGLGLVLIVGALVLAAFNLWSDQEAGEASSQTMSQMAAVIPEQEEKPVYELNPEVPMPETEIDGVAYIGYLEIPALGLELPVITESTYPYLRIAPCRLSGSAYLDNLVIGAHNYNAHFGRLKELGYGDQVLFTDMDGNVFTYEVANIEILQPDQGDTLRQGEYPLSLYTCTIGGKTRLTVRCAAVDQ